MIPACVLVMSRRAGWTAPSSPPVVPAAVNTASSAPVALPPRRPSTTRGPLATAALPAVAGRQAHGDTVDGAEGSVLRIFASDPDIASHEPPVARVCGKDNVWIGFHVWVGARCSRCGVPR